MKKNFFALMTLTLFVFGLSPNAKADFADEAYAFCQSKGGVSQLLDAPTEAGKTCKIAVCQKDSAGNPVDASKCGTVDGAAPSGYVCAKRKICLSDTDFINAGNNPGGNGTSTSGSGNGNGTSTNGNGSGSGNGSVTSGSGSGNGSGDGVYIAGTGFVRLTGACLKACKKNPDGKKCCKCIGNNSNACRANSTVSIDGYVTSGNSNGGGAGSVNGGAGAGSVNGGAGAGSVNGGAGAGSVNGGAGSGSGEDEVSVNVSASVLASLPAGCVKRNGKVKRKCLVYLPSGSGSVIVGGRPGTGNCTYVASLRQCIGDEEYARILAQHGVGADCVNCGNRNGGAGGVLSGIAEIFGAVAPPLAMFGSSYFASKFSADAQKAWANACQNQYTTYTQYVTTNELPGITPQQQASLQCNGSGLGGYAGMNGYMGNGLGGFGNPWMGGGYSPGFLAGMMGPYGMGGIPGMGGGVFTGGMSAGVVQGVVNGGMMAAGYPGGFQGGFNGGFPGGMMAAGYPGGFSAGVAQGVVNGGMMAAGYPGGFQGGFNGGFPGGMIQGVVNGGMMAAGYPGGFQGGFNGGYPGGMIQGVVNGGAMAAGYPGGFTGGYPGGQYPGGYGQTPWGSGTTPWGQGGGYWGATGGWGGQGDYANNQQASNMDAYYQQQGLANQFGMAGQNYQYGGGSSWGGGAGFSPWNAGANLSMNFGMPRY